MMKRTQPKTVNDRLQGNITDAERELWEEVHRNLPQVPQRFTKHNTSDSEVTLCESGSAPSHSRAASDGAIRRTGENVSVWGIGWKAPAFMLLTYFSAILVAILNIVVFVSMDGRPTSSAPQVFLTAFSVAVAGLFHVSLSRALTAAFTQHFWRVVRHSYIKMMTLERVQQLQRDPKMLLRPSVFLVSKVLYLIAVATWLLPIAIIFPPSGLEVSPQPHIDEQSTSVPSFDPAFVGDGTLNGLGDVSLARLGIGVNRQMNGHGHVLPPQNYSLRYEGPKITSELIGKVSLSSGQIAPSASPCGANCTYDLSLLAPYFDCDEEIFNTTLPRLQNQDLYQMYHQKLIHFPLYDATNNEQFKDNASFFTAEAHHIFATFFTPNLTAIYPTLSDIANVTDPAMLEKIPYSINALAQTRRIICRPAYATYNVNIAYENGKRSISYTVGERDYNVTAPKFYVSDIAEGGPCANDPGPRNCQKHQPIPWSDKGKDFVRLTNLRALFSSLLGPISGQMNQACPTKGMFQHTNHTLPNSNITVLGADVPCSFTKALGQLMIAQTPFNAERFNPNSASVRPVLTQDLMNQAMFNITMSMVYNFEHWHQNVTATVGSCPNTYTFSRPLNLFLPYFLLLAMSLPLVCIGVYSLRLNGVAAMSDSFLQVLLTTAGSEKLRSAAAAGCLGGTENIPTALAEMKVKYGDLGYADKDNRKAGIRIAGFGTEDELLPLVRGGTYGWFH